jgi:hypothetical protein
MLFSPNSSLNVPIMKDLDRKKAKSLWGILATACGAVSILTTTLGIPASALADLSMPEVARVTALSNGDYACYVDLVDSRGIKYTGIPSEFEFCENEAVILNKVVNLTYGQMTIADCQGEDPCNKSRIVTGIVQMELVE